MAGVNIPQFRYLEGYRDYLKDLKVSIKEIEQLVNKQEKLLASSLTATTRLSAASNSTFTITLRDEDADDARARLRKLKRTMDPDLVDVIVPNKAALEKQYKLAEELHEKYRTLEAVESQIITRFKDAPAAKGMIREIAEAKKGVGKALRKCLGFISDLANKHVPKSFQKYIDAISEEVDAHVPCQNTQNFLYISVTGEGSLVFTYYKMMEDAINDDGSVTPALYIVVQWVVGNNKVDPAIYVYLEHDYVTPNSLLKQGHGTEVTSAGSAVKAVAHLLSLEQFSSELGVVPLSLAFLHDPANISKSLFSVADLIDTFEVSGTTITFNIKKAVPKNDYSKIGSELYVDVKRLLKNQRTARLRMDSMPGQRKIVFTSVGTAGPLDISYEDAEFFKERFRIDDRQLRRIVHILNQGK